MAPCEFKAQRPERTTRFSVSPVNGEAKQSFEPAALEDKDGPHDWVQGAPLWICGKSHIGGPAGNANLSEKVKEEKKSDRKTISVDTSVRQRRAENLLMRPRQSCVSLLVLRLNSMKKRRMELQIN